MLKQQIAQIVSLSSIVGLSACGAPMTQVAGSVAPVPLRVTNNGQPFQMWEGAAARKLADAECGPRGVRSSIYDRFDRATGEWVYPGGCA